MKDEVKTGDEMGSFSLDSNILDHIRVKKSIFLQVSKMLFLAIILYFGWFQWVFFGIPNLSLVLGAGIIGCIALHALLCKESLLKGMSIEVILWIAFVIASLVIGVVVATNMDYLVSSMISYIQYLILIYAMAFISIQDKKLDYVIHAYVMLAIACAITTLFSGVDVYSNRTSMSASVNPNTTAITMVLGVFGILYGLNFNNRLKTVLQFVAIGLFIFVIFGTGSRNGLFSVLILLGFWVLFVSKGLIRSIQKNRSIKRILFIFVLIISTFFFIHEFAYSNIAERLTELTKSEAKDTREVMIEFGINLFKDKPLFGYGVNNFRSYYPAATYSHNTYIEILVSTGLVGAFLYFIPYISLMIKTGHLASHKNPQIRRNSMLFVGLLVVLLALGMGEIHFYDFNSMIALGFMVSFCNLYYREDVSDK